MRYVYNTYWFIAQLLERYENNIIIIVCIISVVRNLDLSRSTLKCNYNIFAFFSPSVDHIIVMILFYICVRVIPATISDPVSVGHARRPHGVKANNIIMILYSIVIIYYVNNVMYLKRYSNVI